jgi:hypothetical protein
VGPAADGGWADLVDLLELDDGFGAQSRDIG